MSGKLKQSDVEYLLDSIFDDWKNYSDETIDLFSIKYKDTKSYSKGFAKPEAMYKWLMDTPFKLRGKEVSKAVKEEYESAATYLYDLWINDDFY
jgi:hypothetical protein